MGSPFKKPDGQMGRPAAAFDRAALDANRGQPLVYPKGLAPDIRSHAKKIARMNPHFEQQQVDSLVRYCQLLKRWDELEEDVARNGTIIEVERGRSVQPAMNPAFKAQLDLAAKLDALERSLLLQARARREFLAKTEREAKSTLEEKKVANVKRLKIA